MSLDPDSDGNNDEIVPSENLTRKPDELPSPAEIASNDLVFPVYTIAMMDHMHDHIRLAMDTLIELEGTVEKRLDKIDSQIRDTKTSDTIRDIAFLFALVFIIGLLL